MTLTLRAVSLNDHPLTQPITAHFDAGGGSVGRSDHNTLALPDPERHISRQQAEISLGRCGYVIRNVGSANPISVGGQALARGESAPLANHGQVRIGGYLLEVIQDAEDIEASTVVRNRAVVGASMQGTPRLPAPHPLLPDDFDPFAPPRAPVPAAPESPIAGFTQRPPGVFDDLIPSGEPTSIDDLFGLRTPGRDALADFMADVASPPLIDSAGAAASASAPAEAASAFSVDPMAMFAPGGGASASSPHAPAWQATLRDDASSLDVRYVPPAAVRAAPFEPRIEVSAPVETRRQSERQPHPQPPHEPQPQSLAAAPADEDSPALSQALWAAFCEGAGVGTVPRQSLTPELMHVVGSLLQAAVVGTLQLMTVRATAKHELRAQVTMIQARNNNPMKFSPDARSALEQMLKPPMRGFLAGPAAMTDAMHDLVGHSIGTLAGTRAALEGVLDRFTPQQLEAKLAGRSVLDSVLPMNRKAKLWELYRQHFDAIRGEAHEDFHSLFGRAFLAAYEQQLDRLQAEAHAGQPPAQEASAPSPIQASTPASTPGSPPAPNSTRASASTPARASASPPQP